MQKEVLGEVFSKITGSKQKYSKTGFSGKAAFFHRKMYPVGITSSGLDRSSGNLDKF